MSIVNKIYSNYDLLNGTKLYYAIIRQDGHECGFDIYMGENTEVPTYHQPEPFIPNPSLTYEENALNMCKDLSEGSKAVPEKPFVMTEEMYKKQQSDIDFLMLMTEPTL